jgi:outer membrane lipoprotein-sorting protein
MKKTTFIIVGICLLIVTVIVCTIILHKKQEEIVESQKTILDKLKDKSIDMIMGTPATPFRSQGPIGFDTSKKA